MKFLQVLFITNLPILLTGLLLPSLCQANNHDESMDADELVNRVVESYGGIERLEAIESIAIEFAGYRIHRHQSRHTEPPYDRVPVRNFFAMDYEQHWAVRDSVGNYPGGLIFPSRSVIGPDGSFDLDTEQRTFSKGMSMSSVEGIQSTLRLLAPPLLARDLHRKRDEVVLIENRTHRGQEYIGLRLGSMGILVHPETHLIYATLTRRGDMTTNQELEDWQIYAEPFEHQGITFAGRFFEYLPSEQTFTLDYRLTYLDLDADIMPLLEIPDDFVEGANPHMGYANDGSLEVRQQSEGVYLAGDNGTNILYVEFDDYFVAMETGGMAWYAESVYEAMQDRMGNKPLRYVVPTHYHDDHAVGMRFYADIGATILTTPEKVGYLLELLAPIDDGALLDTVKFEFLAGNQRVFADETGELHVLRYASSPHSEDMLVGWLPRMKATFSADIFIGWGNTPEIRQGASYGLRHFINWLEESNGLDESKIDWHLPVHGRPYTRAEVRQMLDTPKTFVTLPANREQSADDWFEVYGLTDESISGRRDFLRLP
ncbi:MAG TPA: MBL fold metallo-hydrolase [Xanthomonadales bacterium]|nr:MBL fold metallo-hydrolase [Xanthomonadales bacterium]